jgi:hypothetical protein
MTRPLLDSRQTVPNVCDVLPESVSPTQRAREIIRSETIRIRDRDHALSLIYEQNPALRLNGKREACAAALWILDSFEVDLPERIACFIESLRDPSGPKAQIADVIAKRVREEKW